MVKRIQENLNWLEKFSIKLTQWVGTPISILVHTLVFAGAIALNLFGVDLGLILLMLTTIVSLEAIYLAIFIQMTVNRSAQHLESVREDVEDIQEDVEELEEDVKEISDDFEDIQADDELDTDTNKALAQIENQLQKVINELESLKNKNHA